MISTSFGQQSTSVEAFPFLVGGYGEGLYASAFTPSDLKLDEPKLLVKIERPSFFCKHPSLPIWYCVSESGSRADGSSGAVLIALRLSQNPMALEEVNRQETKGQGPCYVGVDAKGSFAFVANYGDGSVCMLPINYDGSLAPASSSFKHEGNSVNQARQKEPHAHCAVVDPSDKYVLFADLGMDQVVVYEIDRTQQKLTAQPEKNLRLPGGSGPRHIAFHPTQDVYYVINELLSTVAVVRWDETNGTSKIEQIAPNLPSDFDGSNTTAEILVHPNGKFVFASNRGHDSIASFAVNSEDGHLRLVGHCKTGGKTPRNFRIDPTGSFILAENQQSDSIYILKLDPQTGELTNTNQKIDVPAPACIKFVSEKSDLR